MRIIYRLLILIILVSPVKSSTAQIKALSIKVVENAGDYKPIQNVIDIIKKEKDIYRYIPSIKPLKHIKRVSSPFGWRFHPILKRRILHTGIDLVVSYASFVYATADGEIVYASKKGGYGNCIIIKHSFGFNTLYAHLSGFYCKKNEIIKKGEIIGFVGATGRVTGTHLHYEIRKNNIPINPLNFFDL